MIRIVPGGLDDPRVVELVTYHVVTARAQTDPRSAHALNIDGLKAPGIWFWSAWEDDTLLGTGALKRMTEDHGEVKSMHTAGVARRRGVGSLILTQIIATAREKGLTRLSLETGAQPYFQPALALYAKHGFVDCGPFGDYVLDPNSLFMTRGL